MNKFKFYFFLFCSVTILFSCNKADGISAVPIRDFDEQYLTDMALIEDYLNTHYISFDDNMDATISKTPPTKDSQLIMSYYLVADDSYPQLRKKTFEYNDNTYEIYYMKISADNADPDAKSPSRVDGVLTAYSGSYLYYKTEKVDDVDVTTLNTVFFESVLYPSDFLTLDRTVRGWAEVFPFFKSGSKVIVDGEPTSYTDFGAGIVFIPSGFAYFNQLKPGSSGVTIPSYSPLVFTFKLYEVKEADQDLDGVLSNLEDLNGNGIFTDDDTDGDGVPNFYDADDDGDGYFTSNEIHKNEDGTIIFEDDDNDGIPNYLDPDNH